MVGIFWGWFWELKEYLQRDLKALNQARTILGSARRESQDGLGRLHHGLAGQDVAAADVANHHRNIADIGFKTEKSIERVCSSMPKIA